MNKRERKKTDDGYGRLRNKLFWRIVGMMAASVLIILAVYSVFFKGRFADAAVGFLENYIFFGDYDQAYITYWYLVRNHMDLIFLAAILTVFLILLRVGLKSFTKYLGDINRGIDALTRENTGEIVLPSELAATEEKINVIKHKLEQQKLAAEAAEQRKNDLVVYLAHDLKTPLTSVIGYLTLLRDEPQISDELREKYLCISLEKAERLEDLINEFFEITRFNLTNMTLEYSRINLTRLLEQLIFEFDPMFREKNLTCSLEAEPELMVRCDADKMQRVFDNLLRNAVNYSFRDSTIRICAWQKGEDVGIRFTNRGNTIPPEKLDRIFEQFFRLDAARSTGSGGAGLGLAIAKEIVERHGGSIVAESEEEQIVFQVMIPQRGKEMARKKEHPDSEM